MKRRDPEAMRRRTDETLAMLQRRAAEAPPLTPQMLQELEQSKRAMRSKKERVTVRRANWRSQAAKRHACLLQRTPAWADLERIRAVYLEAQRLTESTGRPHHVDHQIPLQGRLVSGLHVHNNLQVLLGSENSRKCNRFDPWEECPAQEPAPETA